MTPRPPDPLGPLARIAALALAAALGACSGEKAKPAPPPIFDPPSYPFREVVVAWKGSERAPPRVTRTKDEARLRAQGIHEEVRKAPERFAETARQMSDDPTSAPDGGFVGFAPIPGMPLVMIDALAALRDGGVSDVIETATGFHVMQRLSREEGLRVEEAVTAVVDGFFCPWHGIDRNEPESRTKAVAYADASSAVAALRAGTKPLERALEEHEGRGWIHEAVRVGGAVEGYEALAKAALATLPNGYADPVETPQGYSVIVRRPYFRFRMRHVVILHNESRVPTPPKDRPPTVAQEIASKARAELGDDLSRWPAVVAKYSEEQASAAHGGSLGDVSNAVPSDLRYPSELETAFQRLKPGEVSPPFPSRIGFHVLWRVD
jgi:hypothetical protein